MAKAKGKKGKKGKKAEAPPVEEPSEYDTMDYDMLNEVTHMLQQQLEKIQMDRNYVQLERDTIQTFYDITKKESEDHDLQIMSKDREMEIMEENHRVEVRVYIQKVKHLEYEHKNNSKRVIADGNSNIDEEGENHMHRAHLLKNAKTSLKLELKERELSNEDEIQQMKQAHEKNLTKLREEFEKNIDGLRHRCETSLTQLRQDLELRKKVDMHEIEERKNLHINDLMKNHEKAFSQVKNYYNDITHDNLKLIKSLKDEIAEMKKKASANSKLMHDISQENKRLSMPLAAALQEVEHLKYELRDEEKDKLSLRNTKARLNLLEQQLHELKCHHHDLGIEYKKTETERNQLYDSFEHTIHTVQRKSELKNLVLEQRLGTLNDNYSKKETQFNEILEAANLDSEEVGRVTQKLNDILVSRNKRIKDLKYKVAKDSKAYNDALRTYTAKLRELDVQEEQIRKMGFKPLLTATTAAPANLISK